MTRPASVFAAIVTLALVPSTDAFAQITQFDLEAGTGSFIPFAPTRAERLESGHRVCVL